jgi:hypothetical protein
MKGRVVMTSRCMTAVLGKFSQRREVASCVGDRFDDIEV